MAAELQWFVRESLARGLTRDRVKAALLAGGWRAEEVEAALAAYAEVDFPVPVPRRRPHLSAREAFLYLVLFATLYTTAFDVGAVLFHLVDRALPDPAQRWSDDLVREGVRAGTAGLLIAFPVFLVLSRIVGRALEREPDGRSSPVRRWLTYLTLFLAALVLIGDLIALVARLLSGELALRFTLKALVVFLIAGVVFGHYLGALRHDERDATLAPVRRGRLAPRLAALVVVVVAVLGLLASGPPARERRRQLDAIRVRDLQAIAAAVSSYRLEFGALPVTIESLLDQPSPLGVDNVHDPETRSPYEYRTIDSLRYELCAIFTESDLQSRNQPGPGAHFWRHRAGRQCFELRALQSRAAGRPPYEVVAPAMPEPLPR